MDFDDVLQDIGEYDRYQKLMLCFVLLPGILPCGFHAYNQLFMSLIPQHWCLVPELLNHNYTTDLRKKLSIPLKESLVSRDGSAATARSSSSDKMIHHHYSRCHMYDVNYTKLLMDSGQSETVAATAAPPGMTFRFDGHLFQADNVVKLPWIPNASWPVVPCQNGWEYQLEKPASSVVSNVSCVSN